MPRYARAVIPGRSADPRDLDRMVFGRQDVEADEYEEEAVEDDEPDDGFVHRAPRDRRRGGRRQLDFAQLPDDEGSYRDQGSGGRGLLLLVGGLVIAGVFGAVVWNAYKGGVRVDDGQATPLLAASSGPIKTRPPAGAKPSPSALTAGVFDRMEGRDPDAPKVVIEAAAPAAAKPEPQPEPVKVEAPAPAPVEVKTAAVEPKPEPAAKLAPAVEVTPAPVANAPKPLVAAVEPKPTPAAAEPATLAGAFTPKFLPGAAHLVQIGAADSVAGADEEYARRARAAPDLFAGAERVVVPAIVNGNQVYRVRVGSFASAEDANAFCSAYKSRIGDCFRATR